MSKNSCLYIGEIEHRRFSPKVNFFTYAVCYFFLDLSEIKTLFRIPFIFSNNRPGILSFWRKNYFGDKKIPLDEAVRNYINEETKTSYKGAIRLLTNISYFGFCFNPVSFYYCYEDDGETLKYIISEITNTPWGERHRRLFLFDDDAHKAYQFVKDFHVSPFLPMTMDYTWVFHKPAEKLNVVMQNRNAGHRKVIFDSTLTLQRMPLTTNVLIKTFIKFPFVTLKTMLAIYWQALKLFIKKVPFYTHPLKEKKL